MRKKLVKIGRLMFWTGGIGSHLRKSHLGGKGTGGFHIGARPSRDAKKKLTGDIEGGGERRSSKHWENWAGTRVSAPQSAGWGSGLQK